MSERARQKTVPQQRGNTALRNTEGRHQLHQLGMAGGLIALAGWAGYVVAAAG